MMQNIRTGSRWAALGVALVLLAGSRLQGEDQKSPASAGPITKGQRVFTCGHSFHVWVPPILADLANAKCVRAGAYPAWRYAADSRIRELCQSVYRKVSGADAQIKAIHAGLECGLLKEKLPKTDMISFGPNLYNVHTPEEHLSIKSVANTWKFLTAVLAKLK